ncbi:hypothetical protein [Mesorhizobium sp.]|uniref:hypothetical protein n=1 Tax=Mesorhizobium sp. TaxID=1871066 RepID=UPI0012172942|nr:hypothetical protein [Mesorhizobium sp.]TIM37760.1 MAG: hypothetical protein E5Y56_32440 [Mesorhizobium sp.]
MTPTVTSIFYATAATITVVGTTIASGQGLFIGCPLNLRPEIGGICDHLSNLASNGQLSLRFGVPSTGLAIAIDDNGKVSLSGSVFTLSDNGDIGQSAARYEFSVRKVKFWVIDDRVDIKCNVGNCIDVRGPQISTTKISQTILLFTSENRSGVEQSLTKLKSLFPD